jgi:hypothetical protein
LPSKSRNATLTTSGDRACMSTMPIRPVWQGSKKVSHHARDFEKSVWPLFLDGVIPTSQRRGATPHVGRKSVKQLQSIVSFFTHSFIASKNTWFGQEYHDTERQTRLYRGTQVSVPYGPGTPTYKSQVKTSCMVCIYTLPRALQFWTSPPAEVGSGAATCPMALDLASRLRWAPALPHVLWLRTSPPG